MNKTCNTVESVKSLDAIQAIQIVEDISNLLGTGLDKETLVICMRLIENGINPNALAHAMMDIKKDSVRYTTEN